MVKRGTILEINYPKATEIIGSVAYPPITRFGLVESRVESPCKCIKVIGKSGTILYYEPSDLEKYPVIGFVSVGRKYGVPSGRRFCKCEVSLESGKQWPIDVVIREDATGSEITSIIEIRRLAFVDESVQAFLAVNC